MTLARIRELLDRLEISPSKALGQNFLTDENTARYIVETLELRENDCVVEIGPGVGSLTEHLVGRCRRIILVELDARLAAYQRARWENDPSVDVHCADAARWDPRFLYAERPVKLLGNLPYSAGGAIMANLLGHPSPFCRAVLMLQKEPADRIFAHPGEKNRGLFSLRIRLDWEGEAVRIVPPGMFYPQPKIDSAVILLTPRDERYFPPFDRRLSDELARRCFACRRKQMYKQLPTSPPWPSVAAQVGLPTTARAEQLSLSQWVQLTRIYDTHPSADVPQREDELFDVADEEDHTLRQETRAVVHAQGLIHRAVHIFVFNRTGACLLQKRSLLKDKMPGMWDSSAAGHLNAGEDYLAAALRELQEELSIRASADMLEFVAKIPPNSATGMEHVQLYVLRNCNIRPSFPPAEVAAVLFFPPTVISAWLARRPQDFAPAFITLWKIFNSGT